jgi:ribosomal protein L24
MIVIRLTGGRGTVTGQLVHINPNYVAVLVGGVGTVRAATDHRHDETRLINIAAPVNPGVVFVVLKTVGWCKQLFAVPSPCPNVL